MPDENEKQEYERSLSQWRAKLQASLAARPEQEVASPGDQARARWLRERRERASTSTSTPSPRADYTPQYTQQHARQSGYSTAEKPLIAQVTNNWRDENPQPVHASPDHDERELRFCDLEDETSCPNTTRDLAKSRRFRRMMLFFLLFCAALFWVWKAYLRPRFQAEWGFQEGFLHQTINGTYGIAQAGDFDGVRIKDLPPALVPGGRVDQEGKRRLVFIGDIHGCKVELVKLLEELSYNGKTDHLITVGDVVSKGPDSIGVLDQLIRLGADSVRGNHEDRLLEAAKTILNVASPPQSAASTSKGFAKDAALLKQLKPHHLRFMRDMPLMMCIPSLPQVPRLPGKGENHISNSIVVAHAGLVPAVPLDRQDPYFVLNMRTMHPKTHVPSATRASKDGSNKPWFEVWRWYNERLSRGRSLKGFTTFDSDIMENGPLPETRLQRLWDSAFGNRTAQPKPQVVIYGHDSKAGLQSHQWSRGLDSACVAGGKLTALILDAKGNTETVSVQCQDYKA